MSAMRHKWIVVMGRRAYTSEHVYDNEDLATRKARALRSDPDNEGYEIRVGPLSALPVFEELEAEVTYQERPSRSRSLRAVK